MRTNINEDHQFLHRQWTQQHQYSHRYRHSIIIFVTKLFRGMGIQDVVKEPVVWQMPRPVVQIQMPKKVSFSVLFRPLGAWTDKNPS